MSVSLTRQIKNPDNNLFTNTTPSTFSETVNQGAGSTIPPTINY